MSSPSQYKALFSSDTPVDISSDAKMRILEEREDHYVVEYKTQIYNISVNAFDPMTKAYKLIINNTPVELSLRNKLDQLIDELGLKSEKEEDVSQVVAPMPGLVIEVSVSEGDTVEKDQALLILEAMKMENVIKSKGAGTVKKVHITKQDKVDKAQLLIEFE